MGVRSRFVVGWMVFSARTGSRSSLRGLARSPIFWPGVVRMRIDGGSEEVDMRKVGLIFPYFRTRSQTEMLFPPLGLAWLAAQLSRLGLESKIFDCTFGTDTQLRRDIESYGPDIVGIYSMASLTRNTFEIAEMVRASFPDVPIVAGGPLPTLFPARYGLPFDAVFRGEADLSFPNFCRDFFDLKASRQRLERLPLRTYPGLFIHNQSLHIENPTVHHTELEIASFPLPDRSGFDHNAYQNEWFRESGAKTTSIITTFGCPFDCDFCSKSVFGSSYRQRDLGTVFEEIEQICRLGYDSLWIADDTFTLNLRHLESFCEGMKGREISWSCLSRANGIDEAMVSRMKQAGCRRVYLGLESGSPETLKLMDKRITVNEGINAVHQYRQAGIQVAAFFIVGYPGETVESIESTFKLALTLPLDYISFNVPYPLPGSRLFERLSGLEEGRDWSRENEITFVYRSEFDADWLKRRIAETMMAFGARS